MSRLPLAAILALCGGFIGGIGVWLGIAAALGVLFAGPSPRGLKIFRGTG
jgi:hypothetical protein